ncbi:MAG: hypothetical protein IRZ16_14800 [Myxococcaceae bacterium]|nr:hypothetical protein [Myxococcaceae bacterium]
MPNSLGGNMNRTHTRLWGAAIAALVAVGCAQQSGDISYVQPNYVKKSDLLDGIWYFRNTVTHTPPTTGMTFAGEIGKLEKIVFEIQEDHLVGYRAYPTIPGQDQSVEDASKPSGVTTRWCKGQSNGTCVGGLPYYGSPVVIFPIEKHFDIQRGYDPATGETTNTINENASDRPWNEREYIRVDWAHNLAGARLGIAEVLNYAGNSDYGSMIHANEPGTDPYDWPRKEYSGEGPDAKLTYFDFTARYTAKPDSYTWVDDYGNPVYTAPLCWYSPGYDCTSQQIEMRTSLAKVDPNVTNDYEPLVYGNDLMAKFGYFRTERLNYDRRFGFYESDRILLANRHRIWKESFEKDANGKPDWSRPIPFKDRTPKPIVYYVTPKERMGGGSTGDSQAEYDEYWSVAKDLEKAWDHAFRRAVAAAQGKGDDLSGVPQMLYICPNPVPQDATADVIANCGQPGFEARFGDLRKSFLWTVPEAVPNGLLGYGPSSTDPETGEIISANANTYSAAVATYAQYGLDLVNAISGDTDLDELIKGQDVADYFKSHTPYAAVQGKTAPLKSALSADQVTKSSEPSTGAFSKPTNRMASLLARIRASGGLQPAGGDRIISAAEKLHTRPDLESLIVDNPELADDALTLFPVSVRQAAAQNPDLARTLRREVLANLPQLVEREKARKEFFARNNMCFSLEDFEDRPMFALALKESQQRDAKIASLMADGKTAAEARAIADEDIRKRFRQRVWRATAEHEIGHTFGLRHNFQGSFDALNYFDTYWDLRKETLFVDQGTPNNPHLVLPRTPADLKNVSDGTEDQLTLGMMDYEYSSIMDYGGKVNSDWQGIGKYDEAAILFAYSGGSSPGYVEIFKNELRTTPETWEGSDGKTVTITGAGYDVPVINALRTSTAVPNYTERFHYSTLPFHFAMQENDPEVAIVTGLKNMKERTVAPWSYVKEKTEALRQLLETNPVPSPEQVAALDVPAEVPYMFCTDDHVDALLSCHPWDRGPDYYEINRGWLEDYWNGYFFSHFRRDRLFFSSGRAIDGAFNTFSDVSSIYKHWVHAFYGANSNQQAFPDYTKPPFGYDATLQDTWTMATLEGINDLLKVMAIPPAGFYMKWTPDDVGAPYYVPESRWDVISEGYDFDNLTDEGRKQYEGYYSSRYNASAFAMLPRGDARRMYSRYDYKAGFGFWDRLAEVGHYNDQIGAIFASVMPYARFLGADEDADPDRYNIPYYLTFRDELGNTYGSIWALDENALSPTIYLQKQPGGATQPKMVFQRLVKGENYVENFQWPPEPVIPSGSNAARANQQTTWTARIYSLYLGMALFNVNYDLDYAKQNQIIKLGGKEDVTVPAGWEKYEVEDVTTGARYAALKQIGAPDTPAVRMINWARYYRDVAADPTAFPGILTDAEKADPVKVEQTKKQYLEAFKSQLSNMDIARGMYDVYGKAF